MMYKPFFLFISHSRPRRFLSLDVVDDDKHCAETKCHRCKASENRFGEVHLEAGGAGGASET